MKLYIFGPDDQRVWSWLIHRETRDKFVPDETYSQFICKRCGKFSYDDVFAFGFEGIATSIRAKGDIFASDEGFYCVNGKFKRLIETEQFPGLALKPVGNTGWFVVNVTRRFEVRSDVFQVVRGPCPECGRNRETLGAVRHLGQLITRPETETFFSTRTDRQGSSRSDRDLMLTGGIAKAMKQNQIKGGILDELLDEELEAKLTLAWQRGEKLKLPKGSRIFL